MVTTSLRDSAQNPQHIWPWGPVALSPQEPCSASQQQVLRTEVSWTSGKQCSVSQRAISSPGRELRTPGCTEHGRHLLGLTTDSRRWYLVYLRAESSTPGSSFWHSRCSCKYSKGAAFMQGVLLRTLRAVLGIPSKLHSPHQQLAMETCIPGCEVRSLHLPHAAPCIHPCWEPGWSSRFWMTTRPSIL